MIDINTIFSACVSSAVNEIIQPIRAHYDAQLEALQKEITELKQQRAVSPATGEINAEFIRSIAMDAAEQVMAEHLEGHDHDEYDRIVSFVDEDLPADFPDFDDFITKEDLSDAVRDSVRETLENRVSVSLYLS